MNPVRPFLNSLYLSLAVALTAVGIAGGDLLPEIPFITGFCLLLLAAAYWGEGRWELSLRDANLVGLFLGALLGLWGIFQAVRPPTGLADLLPWPASALPYLAPVLMLLIPAKLFRPKHVGDYWAMQGLGLMAMALACAMASDGAFVAVFVVYAVTFVWSLTAFHLYRELGPVRAAEIQVPAGRWRGARPAVLWVLVAGVVAVPAFWITPRSGSQWELNINNRGRATTGLGDGPIDLNRDGSIGVNRETAFEVYAEDSNGQPALDIPEDQRWRVTALRTYDAGRWVRTEAGGIQSVDRALSPTGTSATARERLPRFGPGAIFFTVVPGARILKTPPLADPVAWRSGGLSPVVSQTVDGFRSWVHRPDGSFDAAFRFESNPRYVQAWAAPVRPGSGEAVRVVPGSYDPLARLSRPLPRVKAYTDALVERAVADGRLPPTAASDIDPVSRGRAPRHHEAIARMLEQHLAASGEFAYTLDLTRTDKGIDPTEDFILNTKAGHCQRFATALALMLRTQGVPVQMILGYRGCEGRGDGWYDVREDHAHAWVEALVPAPDAALPPPLRPNGNPVGAGDYHVVRWLSLDPTPAGYGPEDEGAKSLLSQVRERWSAVLKSLVLTYDAEARRKAVRAILDWMARGGWAWLGGSLIAAIALVRWRRARRRSAAAPVYPDYVRRLLAALARRGRVPQPGQTPQEFAAAAEAGLRGTAPADVATVPSQVVAAYYAERFGGRPPDAAERQALLEGVRRLAGCA